MIALARAGVGGQGSIAGAEHCRATSRHLHLRQQPQIVASQQLRKLCRRQRGRNLPGHAAQHPPAKSGSDSAQTGNEMKPKF